MDHVMTFWTIVGAVFGVVVPTVAAAVYVIKLIIGKEVSAMETGLLKHVQETYVSKEVYSLTNHEWERRMKSLEYSK